MMIEQASAAVMNYLGLPLTYYESASADSDASSEPASSDGTSAVAIPKEVELATLLLVGILADPFASVPPLAVGRGSAAGCTGMHGCV